MFDFFYLFIYNLLYVYKHVYKVETQKNLRN